MNSPMHTPANTLGFLPNLGWPEMLIIGIVMLLLFGRRLPEVGKSLGQGIVSFKKGLKEVGDEINIQSEQGTGTASGTGNPPKFDSVKAPNNPDMQDSGHKSANPYSPPASASQDSNTP